MLEDEVKAGRFREDLFYRLNVVELNIPPLRERREDILPLADRFIEEFAKGRARFSDDGFACLEHYPWPGNVRELRNAMERAVLLSRSELILPEHLPTRVRAAAATGRRRRGRRPGAAGGNRAAGHPAGVAPARVQPHRNRQGAGHQPARADLQAPTVPESGLQNRIGFDYSLLLEIHVAASGVADEVDGFPAKCDLQ